MDAAAEQTAALADVNGLMAESSGHPPPVLSGAAAREAEISGQPAQSGSGATTTSGHMDAVANQSGQRNVGVQSLAGHWWRAITLHPHSRVFLAVVPRIASCGTFRTSRSRALRSPA
eukprot:3104425-Prymnesium_polylepis.1